MEGMAGTLGRGVCACRRTPHPPPDPPPHPRGLGLQTDLKASRTEKACPGWTCCVASAEPCPLWVCSRSTVLVASS